MAGKRVCCLNLFIVVAYIISGCSGEDSCIAIPGDKCSCDYNGEIVTLDLDGFPPIVSTINNHYHYYFEPCGSLSSKEHCRGSSVCQATTSDPIVWYRLGLPAPPQYVGTPLKDLRFIYGSVKSADGEYRKSVVEMVCNVLEILEPIFIMVNQSGAGSEDDPLVYNFLLESEAACPRKPETKHLSAGSVLLIIFFVFLFLYVVGGMLVNKFLKGAVGFEILPHYAFWSDFPALLKDGWKFTISCGCCGRSDEHAEGYDNI